MPSRNIVIRSESHRNEEESKRNFSKVIEPWYVNWNDKDYGIDGLVQITSEIKDSADVLITGMLFGVQLKSTGKIKVTGDTICYTLETKKVNQFVSLNLPLLLVLFHTNTSFFYFRWMDESVVTELDKRNTNWAQQKTVTLTLPLENRLTNLALSGLKNHVSSFKVSPRRKIQPGEYFHLKDKALELVNDFASITSRFQFHSTLDASRRLSKEIEVCIYKIVVTGPSRVGKSTLINAFLGKAISPTGITQTTGVPLQFIPGESETVEIYFENRTKQKFPFSLSRITEFASQQENDENYKEVKLISVSSANKLLQNGISLFDIPGLDDASDKILDYSHTTLAKANAILYVIDGSPAEQGGFSFRKEFKKNILELGQSLDRIFLIINKLDVLSDERLTILKDDIKKALINTGFTIKYHRKYIISLRKTEKLLSRLTQYNTSKLIFGISLSMKINMVS